MITPNEREFEALAAQGYNLIPVWREIAADLETPVSAFLKVANGEYAFLLESVQGGEKWGRYTFIGTEPSVVFRGRDDKLELIRLDGKAEIRSVANPFDALREEMKKYRAPQLDGLPRFFGGAVGYLTYDTVRYFERLPNAPHDDRSIPDLHLMLTDVVLVFDNVRQTLKLIANIVVGDYDSPHQ